MTRGSGLHGPPSGSAGSLRDVLIAAGGPVEAKMARFRPARGLTLRTLKTISGAVDGVDPAGHFFPAKLSMAMGLMKLCLFVLIVGLGILSLVLQAALSTLGAGLWAGIIVGVSGFLGVCAARRPFVYVYIMGFMSVSILSMAASGLLIILSATAWARDNRFSKAVFVEKDNHKEMELLEQLQVENPALFVSGALVVLGVLDCLLSLACITISAREACGLYSKADERVHGLCEGQNRKERLYRWLGQQKNIFPTNVGPDVSRVLSPSTFVALSSDSSSSSSPRRQEGRSPPTSASANGGARVAHPHQDPDSHRRTHRGLAAHSELSSANTVSTHLTLGSSSYPAPPSSKILPRERVQQQQYASLPPSLDYRGPSGPPPPHSYAGPACFPIALSYAAVHPLNQSSCYPHLGMQMAPGYVRSQVLHGLQAKHRKLHRKTKVERKRLKDKQKKRRKKAQRELTDKQIEETYTGLDREIAEGFISLTMEPPASVNRTLNSSFDSI